MNAPPPAGPQYSAIFRGLPRLWRTNRFRVAARRLEELGARGRTVVDFGCSDGYGVPFWSRFAGRVIGVDLDARMLASAAHRFRDLPNVSFVHVDDFDYEGDFMVALEVFEHMGGVPANLAVLRRFLTSPERAVFATVPLEVGLPFHVKRTVMRAFPRSYLLHGPDGYDYRPLLSAIDADATLVREGVVFEPFAPLGGAFNRGLGFTVRARANPEARAHG